MVRRWIFPSALEHFSTNIPIHHIAFSHQSGGRRRLLLLDLGIRLIRILCDTPKFGEKSKKIATNLIF